VTTQDVAPIRRSTHIVPLRSSLRLSPTVLAACAALPLSACEHGLDLQGKVSVPTHIQNLFSAQHPGELVVKAQIPGQPDLTPPGVILCEPTGAERVIDVKVQRIGCVSDDIAMVSAWVVPRSRDEVSCTLPPAQPRPADGPPTNAVAFARAPVPIKTSSSEPTSCRDGTISFALRLEPR
jgi:hypothetical protein